MWIVRKVFRIPTVNTNYVHYNFVVAKPQVGITLSISLLISLQISIYIFTLVLTEMMELGRQIPKILAPYYQSNSKFFLRFFEKLILQPAPSKNIIKAFLASQIDDFLFKYLKEFSSKSSMCCKTHLMCNAYSFVGT